MKILFKQTKFHQVMLKNKTRAKLSHLRFFLKSQQIEQSSHTNPKSMILCSFPLSANTEFEKKNHSFPACNDNHYLPNNVIKFFFIFKSKHVKF